MNIPSLLPTFPPKQFLAVVCMWIFVTQLVVCLSSVMRHFFLQAEANAGNELSHDSTHGINHGHSDGKFTKNQIR